MLGPTVSPASAENRKLDVRPPSPFDVVTAQAAHEDDWARFPPAWPHLVVVAENGDGLVYGLRMRHLDGMLTQVGQTCSDISEAKLHLELLYIELTLAARTRGGFYADDHLRQCRRRLATLKADAASRRVQDPNTSPLQRPDEIPDEGAGNFSYPLYYPYVAKKRPDDVFWNIAYRDEDGRVLFDPYSVLGRDDTASCATAVAVESLYKWVKYRRDIICEADHIHYAACERRGYDCLALRIRFPLTDDDEDDKSSYFYEP